MTRVLQVVANTDRHLQPQGLICRYKAHVLQLQIFVRCCKRAHFAAPKLLLRLQKAETVLHRQLKLKKRQTAPHFCCDRYLRLKKSRKRLEALIFFLNIIFCQGHLCGAFIHITCIYPLQSMHSLTHSHFLANSALYYS